eukprot:2975250-Rhodomonas_salina.2
MRRRDGTEQASEPARMEKLGRKDEESASNVEILCVVRGITLYIAMLAVPLWWIHKGTHSFCIGRQRIIAGCRPRRN